MRDRSLLPQIDITIQHFETMLGHERREMDPEVLVHFFGDPRLARCVVACLAHSYRFRSPDMAEAVAPRARARLHRAGIHNVRELRLALFDHLNTARAGFLPDVDRAAVLGELEERWLLRRGQLDHLLVLDADEHAVLERIGREPRAADVAAQYNLNLLACLLRHAEFVELDVDDTSAQARQAIEALAVAEDVDAQVQTSGRSLAVRVSGRQDALGGWSRHGPRVVRLLLRLLGLAGASVTGGEAAVAMRSRPTILRLTPEMLAALGSGQGEPAWADATATFTRTDLEGAVQALREGVQGWHVRRLPEPRAWQMGVLLSDLSLQTGPREHWSLCAVGSPEHGQRLAHVAAGAHSGPTLLFVGCASAVEPLTQVGVLTAVADPTDRHATVASLRAAMAQAGEPLVRAA
jgi:hypothetical protein